MRLILSVSVGTIDDLVLRSRIIWVFRSEPSPRVQTLHGEILLVLVVDPVLVEVQDDDVTDNGGDG